MAKSKDDLKSLSQVFTDDIQFVIPDYQRGYSWEDKQLDDLWEDLENMTETNLHYTGMFTFCKDPNNDKVYTIVDGQQRMTTLIILINEILKRIKDDVDEYTSKEDCVKKYLYVHPRSGIPSNIRYKFQYGQGDPSDAYFKKIILGQECAIQPQKTLYTRNLDNAKRFFEEKIEKYGQDKLISLFKKVTERLKFNEYLIDNLDDVYVTFETMNNRGKNLSTLELLKNRLIYLTTLFSLLAEGTSDETIKKADAKCLRETVNNTWKTIYEYLGKNADKTLSDDGFLRDHWIMYFRYDRKTSMVFKEDLLTKVFVAKRVLRGNLTMSDIDEYVRSLNKSIVCWYKINCPLNTDDLLFDEKVWLTRLNHVGIGSFRPLLMAAYLKKDENFVKLLEACERFRFLTFNVSGRRSNTEDYHFYGLAHDFYDENNEKIKSIRQLIDDVDEKTKHWLNIDGFINSAVDRYKNREGFYSWSGLRYFLYEYERFLQGQTKDKNKKVFWDLFEKNQEGKVSIEHIYPQNPTDKYWISRFVTDEDKNLTHSIGNLLLLSVAKNAEQQNFSFDTKKLTKREMGKVVHNGYDEGSFSEIEVSRESEWKPENIIKRGKDLLKFLIDHWCIDYSFSDDEIGKILNTSGYSVKSSSPNSEKDSPDWEDTYDEMVEVI